jgi:flagellar basal body rod protein FlgG
MSREIYASLSGARAAMRQLDVVANNLSNASTTGFKASRTTFRVEGPDGHALGKSYAITDSVSPYTVDGPLIGTDNPLDLALQGDGYFSIQVGAERLLTRDGHFTLGDDGVLRTGSGYEVLSQSGTGIEIPAGESISVTESGEIFGEATGYIDTLSLVRGPARQAGGNTWSPAGPMVEAAPRVVQGALEGSNTNPMQSMVELIEASRYFEAYQKAMQASDGMDERLNRSGGA